MTLGAKNIQKQYMIFLIDAFFILYLNGILIIYTNYSKFM